MKTIAILTVLAGAASLASARGRNAIDILLSTDGGATWSNSAYLTVGGSGVVLAHILYERDHGYGQGNVVHNVVINSWISSDVATIIDNPSSALHPDGRVGAFNWGAHHQSIYTTGNDLGRARIAAANNTQDIATGGIMIGQDSPPNAGSNFDTSNPAFGYNFSLVFDTTYIRQVTLTTPADRLIRFAVYDSSSSRSPTNQELASVVLDGATVFIPTPSALTCIALGGLVAIRRRRV